MMLRLAVDKSKRKLRLQEAESAIAAQLWQAAKAAVYERDGRVCRYCGTTEAPLTVDHITPKCKGGDHYKVSNLQIACEFCNKLKGGTLITDFQRGLDHYRRTILSEFPDYYIGS